MTSETEPSIAGIEAGHRKDSNANHARISAALETIGCEHSFTRFHPCPKLEGFRGRAHFSIEPRQDTPQLFGVDPRTGAAPFEETQWILPKFARAIVRRIHDRILQSDSFPAINGFDLRSAHGRTECHVSLTAQKAQEKDYAPLGESLLSEIPELTGLAIPSKGLELGATFLNHSLLDHEIEQHYSAFFQTNLHLTPALAAAVQKALGTLPINQLIDLYCGVGLHSIPAATNAARVIGADNHPGAIRSALKNVGRDRLDHAAYILESADRFAASHTSSAGAAVILNPPRAGCSEQVIRSVAAWRPERIVNVSCCLETHLDNLRLWRKLGWLPQTIEAFDMFPFTRFVETVTLLRREN